MKQFSLAAFAALLSVSTSLAQSQRLVLVEHFTQASCGPCAAANPTLEATLNSNSTKAVSIKHQVSWPGSDPMNAHYPAGPNDRRVYYGVSGVPNTVLGGTSGPGAPNTIVTNSTINNRYAVPSPFDMSVSFTKTASAITANVDVTCTQAVSGNLKLHIVVIEKHISFSSPPGSNGETDFHNVMKQMLPNTSGTTLASSWAVNDNQSFSESWTWSNVYDENELAVVAFIQDHSTKEVHQAGYASAVSPSLNDDIGISDVVNGGNICSTSFTPQVTLTNYGLNTLTAADVIYDIDGGASSTFNWAGSLASGASTNVTLPATTVTAGYHTFNVATSQPNGVADQNASNDNLSEPLSVGTETIDVNITTDCWGSETTWEINDASGNTWVSGGGYPNVTGGDTYSSAVCLIPGQCYDFVINDGYGDGMYGSQYGSCTVNGTYSIEDQSSTVLATMQAANSNFGNQEINNFCVPTNPVSNFSASPTTVCEGESVTFSDLSTGSITGWSWSFPGGTPATSTNQNPTVTYNSAGTYDVTLVAIDGAKSDTLVQSGYIVVNANPTGTTAVTDASCGQSNGSVTVTAIGASPFTYSWSPVSGSSATLSGLAAGVYDVTITDNNGCQGTATGIVSNPGAPTVGGTGTDATCDQNDGEVTISVQGGQSPYTYSWTPNVSTTNSATGLSSGTYNVTATDANGCSGSTTVTITAPPLPVASTASTDEVCDGDCDGTLTGTATAGTAPYTYSWNSGVGNVQNATGICPGTYELTVTDDNGCTSTSSVTIAAGAAIPVAGFTVPNTTVNIGDQVNFTNTSVGGSTYGWDFGDGNISNAQDPSNTYNTPGTYTVTLTATNSVGCFSTETMVITVEDPSGIPDENLAAMLSFYPNPTEGELNLTWDELNVDKVEITNHLGQILYQKQNLSGTQNCQFDMGKDPKGIYFIHVYVEGSSFAKKFILQ